MYFAKRITRMFRFFRRMRKKLIRENNSSSYLLYAAGEIILVVIGIIIALQINIWNRATVDELKSTGILGFIKNETLSKMIANYDALTHHLDVDYIDDRVQFEKTTELITAIINNNYPNFTEGLFTNEN